DDELLPDRLRRALQLSALRLGIGGVWIDKHRNRCRGGHDLAQQLKSFRSQYAGEKDYAGDVAARPAEAGDEAVPDRVAAGHEHDRHGRGCGLGRERRIVVADDHRHRTADQISDQRRQAIKVILRRAVFDRDVLILDVAGFPQPMAKRGHEVRYVSKRRAAQKPDHWHRLLLPARRKRPCCRAAEERYERAAFHSITSSARASSVGGISIPNMRAVCTLMTSSNLADCSTGKSAGLAPLRMRPT